MPSELRVLLTADAVGGVWHYAADLTRELAPKGVRFLIATMGPRPSDQERRQMLSTPGVELAESDFALEWMDRADPGSRSAAGDWLAGLAREFAPHVLHFNGYVHALRPWDTPVLVAAHSCVGTWWRAVHQCDPPAEWSGYRDAVRLALSRASAVVTPSRSILQSMQEFYGSVPRRAAVIHNFSGLVPVARRKQSFVLAVGRVWDESKNLRVLDRAAAGLDWPILIAGATQCAGKHAPEFKNASLQGSINREELAKLLSAASIFAHPAVYEPFGLAALEAAQCGCALILSDIPTMRELWDDAAVFVPPRDARAWRRQISLLAGDAALRADYGARARRRSRRYVAEQTAGDYLRLYTELSPS